jgi:subtilisin family serine protease
MRYHSVRSAVGVVVAVLVLSATTQGQVRGRGAVERIGGRDAVAGEAIVKFRSAPASAAVQQLGQQHDLDHVARAGRAGALRIRSRSRSAADLVQRLAANPDIEYVEPNYIVRAVAQPDDPQFPQLWGLLNTGQTINGTAGTPGADIHAAEAWNLSVGSKDNVVAVIDTGVDYTHPELAGNIWSAPAAFTVTIAGQQITCPKGSHGFNAITLSCDPMDDNVHGTHVAGTIGAAGNNGVGVTGVNWTASIMAAKFLDANGSGSLADALNAIDFVIQAKQAFAPTLGANVRVLSNSWGGGGFSQAMLDEINLANANDMLFVAAAGNNGLPNDSFKFYPASYNAANVIAVAATTNQDGLAYFSNYGAATVHLGAPGVDILSTAPNNGYLMASGTSMATPHVSGAAMLLLSRCSLSTADLKTTILSSTESVPALAGKTITGGRLDVNGAMHACLEPPSAPVLSSLNGDRQVILTWTGGTGSTGFTVKRSLAAGGPYSQIASDVRSRAYTDSSVTNGTTYYYVVNGTNSFGDGPMSNEVAATPHAPPDLVISAFTAPGTGGAGLSLTMTVTVKNQGTGNADPSSALVYFSDDTAVGASDTPIGAAIAVPALAAGASFATTFSAALPTSATTGQHYLIAATDVGKTNIESSETNNTLVRSLLVGPDLTISTWTAPSSAAPGATISITDTITNQGGGPSAASITRYYLSVNAGLDSSDTLLAGGRAVPELAPGSTSTGTASITLPSDIGVGAYYIFAKADGDNTVAESQEWNNTSLKLINIGGDLVVSSFTAPATAGPGTIITVMDTTGNTGSGAIGASTTRFYLSANAGLDASDILLDGGHSVPALAAGASHTSSTPVTIPASIATGSYYLFAKADGDNTVPETQESNNTATRMIQIGSDLVISTVTIPAKGGAGLPLTISDTTTNQGAATTPPTQTRYYLSTNLSLDSSDTPLSPARDVPSLAPGQSNAGSVTLTLPSNAPSGVLYILVQADGANAVAETSETNNVSFRSIQVGPDLIASALSGPTRGGIGLTVDVTDTVVNQGAGGAAASTVRYYISPNVVLDAKATLVGGRPVPALGPGDANTGTTTLTVPASTLAGSYFIIAAADGDSGVPESQEFNNTAARSIAIGPDLFVSGFAAPASAPAGATLSVFDTVTNQGVGGADATTTRFYLSANVLFDASDLLLAGARPVPALAGGTASTGSSQVTIPAGTAPGNYFLLAVTDGDNVVRESSETNNALARSIQITAP